MKLSSIRKPSLDGRLVNLADFPGVKVRIKPADDIDYRRATNRGLQPHAKKIRKGRLLDPAITDRITARAIAETLLLDWKGIEDDAGQPVPYSQETALEWAEDPEYTSFFSAIEREANDLADRDNEDRDDLGKS